MQYIKAFFVGLGVIFFIILIALTYLWVADPWNIKPLLQAVSTTTQVPAADSSRVVGDGSRVESQQESQSDQSAGETSAAQGGGVSAAQAEALGSVGLSVDAIPATFTAEQEACFIEILGASRVEEIKNGAVPSATEFWQARGCL